LAELLDDLTLWINADSIGEPLGANIYQDNIPDEPDSVIVLTEYNSKTALGMFNSAVVRYVQVLTRSPSASAGKAEALKLFKLFNTLDDNITDLPNDRWAIIKPLQSPFKISEDGQNRIYYGFNVAITTNCD
jgi:hypothetical protein